MFKRLTELMRGRQPALVRAAAVRQLHLRKEKAALAEIDRLIHNFGGRLPQLSSLRVDLLPAVRHAQGYLARAAALVPGPVELQPGAWEQDPLLKGVCTGSEVIVDLLRGSAALQRFFEKSERAEAIALLKAAKREKVISGTRRDGDIIRRDELQKAVFFEEHELLGLSADPKSAKRWFASYLMDGLLAQVLSEFEQLREWRQRMAVQHEMLELKLTRRDLADTAEAARLYADLDSKLRDVENRLSSMSEYRRQLEQVLLAPQQFLTAKKVVLKLDCFGIRRDDAADEECTIFPISEFAFGGRPAWSAAWVRIRRQVIAGL